MSKAADAQQAALQVREQAFRTGKPVHELIEDAALGWNVQPGVVKTWLLRDPQFESLTAFDQAVATSHRQIADNELRRLQAVADGEVKQAERARRLALKFTNLAQIVDSIPRNALLFAMLNTVGFVHARSWRDWIQKNCWEQESDRNDALAFAHSRLRARLDNEKATDAANH